MKIFLLVAFAAAFRGYATQQIQMPEASALTEEEVGMGAQVAALQRNVTALWSYISELRAALANHLNALRQHQVELEGTVHQLSHHAGTGLSDSHTDGHHHSGEHHHHSGEQHSHSDSSHSHGEQHSHDDHSHGDSSHHPHGGDDHHSHSGEHHHDSHSHTGDDEHHSSHTGDDQHHDHKDSHEKSEDIQQSVQGADVALPDPPATTPTPSRGRHHQHHHGSHSATPLAPLPIANHVQGGHESRPRNHSRTVVLPKYSEDDLFDFAVCDVRPNRNLGQQQHNVQGQVTFWQKKSGGPLNLHVRLAGFAVSGHHHHEEQALDGQEEQRGHRHGFHVHASADLSEGCESTGPHFNPKGTDHGGPDALVRHVGDLGNIACDERGVTNIVFSDHVTSIRGPHSIVGKALVIHADADDSGQGGNEESLRGGNAGARIACCVVYRAEKLPIRSYKAIRTAAQRTN